ncbi:hypothetical protein [Streptomyces sp. NPDC014006]|uniref:hypothetical protein n=1 Tax=Streptomyces sp. NPDC014006 TaxID=3364870 RepID=UPI0036F57698
MDSDRQPAPSRRTVLRGAALAALTTVASLNATRPLPAHATVPAPPEPPQHTKHTSTSHRSYRAIVGVL